MTKRHLKAEAVTFSDGLETTSKAMQAWGTYIDQRNQLASLGANQVTWRFHHILPLFSRFGADFSVC